MLKRLLARALAARDPAPEVPRPLPEPRAMRVPAGMPDPGSMAIVGLAGRYPKAGNVEAFWRNLSQGVDCISEIPKDRWDHDHYFHADRNEANATYGRWGGFLDDVDKFDALFFNIAPREAERMDPQERLFLQCTHDCLEDAGYNFRGDLGLDGGEGVGRKVGVFVGVMYQEYQLYGAQRQVLGDNAALYGNSSNVANRVSYFFDFHGPSMALDTMCSSSLSALHLACQAIRNGDCEIAVAGGVNLSIHPNKYLVLGQGRFLSSKGQCQSFGLGGDGYVPAEGVGAVLVKPLAKALRDGDQVYATLLASAVNHGGRSNGYTGPNPNAQAAVVTDVLRRAGVNPRAISYVEAHGTGTSLGDPIEITGLKKAFRGFTSDHQFCAIGSAKSNIGHGESAAGIAGLTKVLLQMKHRQLAPSLHSRQLNPHIRFDDSPFFVQQELSTWVRPVLEEDGVAREFPRMAGLSSFGAGGANAHVLVQEAPEPVRPRVLRTGVSVLVVLSAKNNERLRERAVRLVRFIETTGLDDTCLHDMAWTLQVGREEMDVRLAFEARAMHEVRDVLQAFADGAPVEALHTGNAKKDKAMLAQRLPQLAPDGAAGLLAARDLAALARLWVHGLVLSWPALYGADRPMRMSLPTYPFARERCWAKMPDLAGSPSHAPQALVSLTAQSDAQERACVALRLAWRAAEALPAQAAPRPGWVLLLANGETEALATALARRLPQARVVLEDATHQDILPDDEWSQCAGLIDVVGCGTRETSLDDLRWTGLVQRCIESGRTRALRLVGVTRGLEGTGADVRLAGAGRVPLYRLLGSEYPRVASCHLDLDAATDDARAATLIAAEFASDRDDRHVCLNQGGRRVPELVQERWGDVARAAKAPLGASDVVMVTGGTRGIGLLCARHLVATHGVRRLVLTGRDVLPPRSDWAAHAAAGLPSAGKLNALMELERLGATVQVCAPPLEDRARLQAQLDAIAAGIGPVTVVLHCAGRIDSDTLSFLRKTPPSMQRVLSPKTTGLANLLACLDHASLRRVVLFSSVSARLPALASGQLDYALANAYMDHFAEAWSDRLPVVSVQWGSWRDTGMGEALTPAYARTGLLSYSNAEGLRILDEVLASDRRGVLAPVVVAPARLQANTLLAPPAAPPSPAGPQAASPQTVRPPQGAGLQPRVERWLVDIVADQLRIAPGLIEVDVPLQDYGMDSVLLAQSLRQIGKAFGDAELDPSVLYEQSTIAGFAAWLCEQHGARLDGQLGDPDLEGAAVVTPAANPAPRAAVALAASAGAGAGVAVVGMSCRFPGARDVEAYWRLLEEGRSAIAPVPEARWGHGSPYSAGLVDDLHRFDCAHFMLSSADARAMDPQALVVLEEVLALCHQAGYTPADWTGQPIGVYLGGRSQHVPDAAHLDAAANPVLAVGQNYMASNVAKFFDLRGPSLVVDTACSSALVAMNLALQALHAGEIQSAIVGGVSLLTTDSPLKLFARRGILSDDSRFHLFDRRARGAVLGEGVGMVLLKRVEQAVEDGDRVYAVIRGVAINNDGRTAGPAAPNPQAQRDVMQTALAKAGLQPGSIAHVEVNGAGSEVHDLLELRAIQSVYRNGSDQPCYLGSVKPNIGHPLCAEGIASFIKVALMLSRGRFVPFLSAQEPLRHFDLAASPLRFKRSADAWPAEGGQAAAINCFADGGTNAHVVLEAWKGGPPPRRQPLPMPRLQRVDVRAPTVAVRDTSPADQGASSRPVPTRQPVSENPWGAFL